MEQNQVNLYSLLLEQIKSIEHYDESIVKFLEKLNQTIGQAELLQKINERINDKQIFFIRHAESKYNEWRKQSTFNWSIFYKDNLDNIDPGLTEKGIEQTKLLQTKIENDSKELIFDIIYVSPLSRAVDTFGYLAFKQEEQNLNPIKQFANARIFGCHYIRERLDTCGDIGKNLDFVNNTMFKKWNINCDLVNNNGQWWSHAKFDESKKELMFKQKTEDFDKIQRRLLVFLLMVIFSNDKTICLVSHSNIFKCMMLKNALQSHGINNAEMKLLEKEQLLKFLQKTIPKHIYKKK